MQVPRFKDPFVRLLCQGVWSSRQVTVGGECHFLCCGDGLVIHRISAARMIHQTIFYTVRSSTFKTAQQKFVSSMAAYSMICYLLQVSALAVFAAAAAAAADLPQIKDRHDGNILMKRDGRCARACVVNTE
jgi:hypothetical protein